MPRRSAAIYSGIFLVALATLMLEILLTRITSVVGWYHMAFFVISLAMLGMTTGAVWVTVRPDQFTAESVNRQLARWSLAFAVLTPLSLWLALRLPLIRSHEDGSFLRLLVYGAELAVPFFCSGVVLTLALTRAGLSPGRVYGVDLLGAAAGCVLVSPLLDMMDAPSAAVLSATIAALGGLAFA